MPNYLVVWKIDVETGTPEGAATLAHAIAANPDNTATIYEVYERVSDGTLKPMKTIDVDQPQHKYQKPKLTIK